MASPKPYVLITDKSERIIDVYADPRLLDTIDNNPALRRDSTDFSIIGSELVRYWVNPRYDQTEVAEELHKVLNTKWREIIAQEKKWEDALDDIEQEN